MACFQPSLLYDQLVFYFQSGVSGQISALILEPSFISITTELTFSDPEFAQFLVRVRGSDAIFRVITIYCIDLLYLYPWY